MGLPLRRSGGLLRVGLSRWLGLATLLFVGWIVVMPLVATGPAARPVAIAVTGLLFSAITATAIMRSFGARDSVGESAATHDNHPTAIFAYPLAYRRLLRSGRILFPLFLGLQVVAFVIEARWTFVVGFVLFGLLALICQLVMPRFAGEIRVSNERLDVRMIWGPPISIAWHEIARLQVRSRRGSRLRVETRSGIGFSVDSSLPGYAQLLSLIEKRSVPRDRAGD